MMKARRLPFGNLRPPTPTCLGPQETEMPTASGIDEVRAVSAEPS